MLNSEGGEPLPAGASAVGAYQFGLPCAAPGARAPITGAKADALTLRRLRQTILETSARAGEGHIPSAYSVLEIIWALYDRVMQLTLPRLVGSPSDTGYWHPRRDRLILSKGHACLALYAVLAEKGIIDRAELDRFCQPDAMLQGHPSRDIPGVECSTGSLGHGLPMAVGMAYALKLAGNPARVFCIVGDTEAEEGAIWESAMLAARFGLNNLAVIVDNNSTSPNGIDGTRFETSLQLKWSAFGWNTWEIDGHDCDAIEQALQSGEDPRPLAVIAKTVKGYGCKPIQSPAWHRRSPTAAELPELIAAL